MSIGFLLANPSDAVIWRGPKKNGIYNKTIFFMYIICIFIYLFINLLLL